MPDTPAEFPALHAGLAVAAAVLLAVAGGLPLRPAPDAAGVAGAVDRIAADGAPASATVDHGADAVRVRPDGLALRNGGGTAHATFAFGPVVPVSEDGALRAVLRGSSLETAFAAAGGDERAAFRRAVAAAREREPRWQPSAAIRIRGVSIDGQQVVLVGV